MRVAETDLLALSQRVPDFQVAGQGKTALVRYVLGRVSLGEILGRARSKVDNPAQRFRVFWGALNERPGVAGARVRGGWAERRRLGSRLAVHQAAGPPELGNVREMSYDDFRRPTEPLTYSSTTPDEPGHTVDEDRLSATNVRKSRASFTRSAGCRAT